MAAAARKADQQRRCNDEWLYCFNCGILVLKDQSCQEYLCHKSFADSKAEWQALFAEEEKLADQNRIEYEARQAAITSGACSSGGGGGGLTGNGGIDKTWNGHLSYHVAKETAYWDSIKGKWGNDWECDIIFKLEKIYESKERHEKKLPSVPDGSKSSMLNLFRNTDGAKAMYGERTEQEILDNVLTLLNEAENVGILAP